MTATKGRSKSISISPNAIEKEAARAFLLELAEKHDGFLKPETVVEAARDPMSPIHDRFEWDDTEAARHYRNVQAGVLIRMIKITVIRNEPESKNIAMTVTREFQSLPSERKSGKGSYQTIDSILSDPERRAELVATVLKELGAYRQRYATIDELAAIWVAYDKTVE